MKLLVTGCEGQVGEAVCSLAATEGIECKGLPQKKLDVTRASKVHNVLRRAKPDYVINAAAFSDIEAAESETAQCYTVNREGVFYLAKSCSRLGLPLIHLSSSYVFDGAKAAPYVEDDACNPLNIYGRSKVQGEHALKSVHDKYIILRVNPVFSEWGDNFLKDLLADSVIKRKEKFPEDQLFAPTSASDIARVIIAVIRQLDCDIQPWGTYHYSSSTPTSWYGFAQSIIEEAGHYKPVTLSELTPVESENYGYSASRPLNAVLNCTRILETFGIRQRDWLPEVKRVVRLCCQD